MCHVPHRACVRHAAFNCPVNPTCYAGPLCHALGAPPECVCDARPCFTRFRNAQSLAPPPASPLPALLSCLPSHFCHPPALASPLALPALALSSPAPFTLGHVLASFPAHPSCLRTLSPRACFDLGLAISTGLPLPLSHSHSAGSSLPSVPPTRPAARSPRRLALPLLPPLHSSLLAACAPLPTQARPNKRLPRAPACSFQLCASARACHPCTPLPPTLSHSLNDEPLPAHASIANTQPRLRIPSALSPVRFACSALLRCPLPSPVSALVRIIVTERHQLKGLQIEETRVKAQQPGKRFRAPRCAANHVCCLLLSSCCCAVMVSTTGVPWFPCRHATVTAAAAACHLRLSRCCCCALGAHGCPTQPAIPPAVSRSCSGRRAGCLPGCQSRRRRSRRVLCAAASQGGCRRHQSR